MIKGKVLSERHNAKVVFTGHEPEARGLVDVSDEMANILDLSLLSIALI